MEYVKLSNILGEASAKIEQAANLLAEHGLTDWTDAATALSSALLGDACQYDPAQVKGAGLLWQEAQIVGGTVFAEGRRYHTWGSAIEASAVAGDGWRLPTPEEIEKLYKEDPESPVFQPNGRYGSRKPGKVDGVSSIIALWTSKEDSRDFAIECTADEGFGLTSHPAFKGNCITAWIVKEL